jgi:hypothetical protein
MERRAGQTHARAKAIQSGKPGHEETAGRKAAERHLQLNAPAAGSAANLSAQVGHDVRSRIERVAQLDENTIRALFYAQRGRSGEAPRIDRPPLFATVEKSHPALPGSHHVERAENTAFHRAKGW